MGGGVMTTTDDGPGRDQHGPRDLREREARTFLAAAEREPGLGDAELETRIRDIIHQREQGPASILSRRTAARQIIALVREHDRRASHEGATVSAELPAHLRDDAPYQVCDCCGRKTWATEAFSGLCGMRQPDGQCPGKFGPLTFYGNAEEL